MSYLTETATFELDPHTGHSGPGGNNNTTATTGYDYHLPHTKTIDLIGEEFAPKSRAGNVVVESIGGANPTGNGLPTSPSHNLGPNVVLVNTSNSGPVPLQVQQILQQTQVSGSQISNNIVSVALSQAMGATPPQSHQQFALPSSNGSPSSVVIQPGGGANEYSFQTSPAAGAAASVTVDLPSIQQHPPQHHNSEENGVLLCNLDDLSRYIPENFYSDFNMADNHVQSSSANLGVPDYLQTVVAGKAAVTTTVSALPPPLSQSPINPHSHQHIQPQLHQPQTITVHLPTQPQPIQGVKTVTYVSKSSNDLHLGQSLPQVSPGKITQYAYTPSGERIAITGISPEATKPGSTVQVQVKGGGYQTLQLTAIDPQGHKQVVHDHDKDDKANSDTIISILEEMKQEDIVTSAVNEANVAAGMNEYTTAIPVAVTSDPKRTTIKRVAGAQTSTVYLPNNAGNGSSGSAVSGNNTAKPRLIFAGNTIPPGAIPIQINGLNAIPITAVKSIPLSTVISPSTASISGNSVTTPSQSKKTSSTTKATKSSAMVTKVSNNNGGFHKIQSNNLANINKAIGNNKTCNWVFENGEVCGKTFSKSYNLVVHMRMHEDVRPFGCSLCDQTFRQKAHLQRHETTHGIGVKISNRTSSSTNSSAGMPRRKRKRSTRGSTGTLTPLATTTSPNQAAAISANLQERLARVSEQFANKDGKDEDDLEDHADLEGSPHPSQPKIRRLSVRIDSRCNETDPNAAFQPYIATAEEAANAAAAAAGPPRTSPHILDNALTAAVNEAISTDMM